MLWLLIWRFGPEENDGCQSDQSHKTQTPFLSTEHSSCICAWHVGAVGVFSAYGYLQLPGGPALLQPLVTGLGMVSFYFGASSGLLACSVATVLDWRRRRQLSAAGFWVGGGGPALPLQSLGAQCPPLLSQLLKSSIAFQVVRDWSLTCVPVVFSRQNQHPGHSLQSCLQAPKVYTFNKHYCRNFPGGPVVKTPCSQCRGPGFNSCAGN